MTNSGVGIYKAHGEVGCLVRLRYGSEKISNMKNEKGGSV